MANDLATLGIIIDSSQVKVAANDLDKLGKTAGNTENAIKSLTGAFSRFADSALSLKSAFQAIIAAAPLIMLKDMIEHVVEGRAQLERLAQQAGTTAEGLGRFQVPVAKAAGSLDDVSHAMFMLSRAMEAGRDPLSRQGQAFASIGIGLAQIKSLSPDQMFELIAHKLQDFTDGAQKNAVMQELLGRAGYGMAAVMKEVATSTEMVSKTTNEQAEEARKLEQQWTLTRLAFEETKKHAVDEMLPALKDISTAVLKAAQDSGTLMAAWVALGGVMAHLLGLDEASKLKNELDEVNVKLALFVEILRGRSQNGNSIFQTANEDIIATIAKLEKRKKEIETAINPNPFAGATAEASSGKGPNFDPDAVQKLNDALLTYNDIAGKASGTDGDYLVKLKQLDLVRKSGKVTMAEYTATVIAYIKQQPGYIANEKAKADAIQNTYNALIAEQKVTDDMNAVQLEFNDNMRDGIAQQKFENDLLGKSADAILKLTAARKIDLDVKAAIARLPAPDETNAQAVAAYTAMVEQIKARGEATKVVTAAQLDQNIAVRAQLDLWNMVANAASGFFTALMHGGKSAVDYLRNLFKTLLAELIRIFTTRWILNLGASVAGGAASGVAGATESAASSALTSAAGSVAGSAVLSTVGGLASAYAGSAVGVVGTEVAANVATLGVAAEAGSAAVGGLAEVAAAAIPVIGWIVAIGAILYALFSQSPGGPKTGGAFFGAFTGSGGLTDDLTGSIDRNQHLQNETALDSVARNISTSLGVTIAQSIKALGGTSSGFQVGVGFNRDPSGTAQSAASTLLRDSSGRTIFEQSNTNVSRDDGAIEAELGLQGQRAVLAALQASNLPKEVANIINSLVATTASSDDIQRILAAALDMKNVLDNIGKVNLKGLNVDTLKAWQRQGETLTQTLQRVGSAMAQFDDAFMTDAQKIQAAQDQVTSAFTAMGIAVPESSAAFYDLVHSIDVSTDAGRTLVEQLLAVGPAFQSVTQATAQAVASMYNTASSLSASFGSQYAQANLQQAAQAWMAIPGANPNGWSTEQIIQEVAGLTKGGTSSNPGGFSDALRYVQSLGPAAVIAFNNLLNAYKDAQTASQQTTQSLTPLTTGIEGIGNAAGEAAAKMSEAQSSLRGYLDSLLGDAQLSPLSPMEKLGAARNSFEALVAQAAAGDTNAMGQLAGAHRAYLQIAREVYASGAQYNEIFNQSTNELAGVSEYSNWQSVLTNAMPKTSPMASQVDIQVMTRILVNAIAGAAAANDASVEQQTQALQPPTAMVRR